MVTAVPDPFFHDDPRFSIYFGDVQDALYPSEYRQWESVDLMSHLPVKLVAHKLSIDHATFLAQVHGTDGVWVTKERAQTISPFSIEGDFLITQAPRCGIGIVTADCLPVVCYDQRHHVAGVAHAGWRGAVAGVVDAMISMMHQECGTMIADTLFFYGPSARPCCYEVDEPFIKNIPSHLVDYVLEQRDGVLYCRRACVCLYLRLFLIIILLYLYHFLQWRALEG